MKTMVMHVGMHKTGTTSLQMTLHRHRGILLDHGINYMDTEPNHSHAIYSLFAPAPHTFHVNMERGIDSPKKAAAHNIMLKAQIESACSKNASPIFVVSGEAISALSFDSIVGLKALFSPYFDRIHVLGYVRPPRSYMNSAAMQWLRRGWSLDEILDCPPEPKYRFRFEKFDQIFGDDNQTLRLFAADHLVLRCVVASFLNELGVPRSVYERLPVVKLNEAVSLTAAKLLSIANRDLPMVREGKPNPERAERLVGSLSRVPGPPFALPADVLSRAVSSAREDIEWMEQRLGTSLHGYDGTSAIPSSLESFAAIDGDELGSIVQAINRILLN